MKKSLFPSGEIVGLNSGSSLFTLKPRFSILMIVLVVMTFSFCCFNVPEESFNGCAVTHKFPKMRIKRGINLFTDYGFRLSNNAKRVCNNTFGCYYNRVFSMEVVC